MVGLPLGLSGADTDQTRETRAWADRLAAAVAVPVELYDERFTTAIAAALGRRPHERGLARRRRAARGLARPPRDGEVTG